MITIGVDLGKEHDYTAICIVQSLKQDKTYYNLIAMERQQLGTPYNKVVDRIGEWVRSVQIQTKEKPHIVFDKTGVGNAVVDYARMLLKCVIHPVHYTAGNEVHGDGVPKTQLVTALQLALQTERLKIAPKIKDYEALLSELANYRTHINSKNHVIYEPDKHSGHDDMVMSLALAVYVLQLYVPMR